MAGLLAGRGAAVLSADQVVRELQEPGAPAYRAIRGRFGDQVVAADGTLDRDALAAHVFTDPEARADLEAMVHPLVRATIRARLRALAGTVDVVVVEIPLLVEGGAAYPLSAVAVVDCPVETAVRRLVDSGRMDEADARRRLAAQTGRDERRAIADVVIDNSGDLPALQREVDRAWDWMRGLPPVTVEAG